MDDKQNPGRIDLLENKLIKSILQMRAVNQNTWLTATYKYVRDGHTTDCKKLDKEISSGKKKIISVHIRVPTLKQKKCYYILLNYADCFLLFSVAHILVFVL